MCRSLVDTLPLDLLHDVATEQRHLDICAQPVTPSLFERHSTSLHTSVLALQFHFELTATIQHTSVSAPFLDLLVPAQLLVRYRSKNDDLHLALCDLILLLFDYNACHPGM